MNLIRRCAVSMAMVIVVLNTGRPASAIDGTPSWLLQQVAANQVDYYISSPDLSFDHFGAPFVAWSSVSTVAGSNSVRLSQRGSLGLWSTRDLAAANGIGLKTSLSFDRAERPAVGWVNTDTSVQGSFNYAAAQPVAATGASAANPIISLDYDLAGAQRGMFAGSSVGNLSAISHNGSSFSSGAMTSLSGIDTLLDAGMTTDDRGLRHVAARVDLSGGSKAVALLSEPVGGGTWSSSIFTSASDVDGVDIARDPTDGRIGFAYTTFDNTTSRLFYAKFNGFSIQTTQILSSASLRYEDVSLAYDLTDGKPAIAYERRNAGVGELWMAYQNPASQWLQSSVDLSMSIDMPSGAVRRPSLSFDDYGTSWPAIAYVNDDGALSVAFDPPAPEPAALGVLALGMLLLRRRRD